MPALTLPDGSVRHFDGAVTGLALAESIGKKLAKDAVAINVDGALTDLTAELDRDATVSIVTRDSEAGLELLRHDAAHVMAQAVKELYPEAQVTIGPAIEDGFYYDFSREARFTPDDLEVIEAGVKAMGGVRAAGRAIGTSHSTVRRWLRGEDRPPTKAAASLRKAAQGG